MQPGKQSRSYLTPFSGDVPALLRYGSVSVRASDRSSLDFPTDVLTYSFAPLTEYWHLAAYVVLDVWWMADTPSLTCVQRQANA